MFLKKPVCLSFHKAATTRLIDYNEVANCKLKPILLNYGRTETLKTAAPP